MSEFGQVFTPLKIGNVIINNRLVRSATHQGRATEDGHVTDDLIKVYEDLARGGVGLTITGVSIIREDGCQLSKMLGNYSDDYVEGLSRLAGAYHDASQESGNKSRIFLQIGHAGDQVSHWGYQGELISSSAIENIIIKKTPHALTIDEIKEITSLYGDAVRRAKKAGFDGAQLHGAHGYLITQFYSPYMNKRGDQYGGSTENRARFVLEILIVSRKRVGNDFPIAFKMNGSDRIKGGLEIDEAAKLAKIFAKAGFNALEISSYINEAMFGEKVASIPPESQKNVRQRGLEAFNLELAKKIKEVLKKDPATNVPIILVGGLYRFETIKNIVDNFGIEFCSMCRPLIRQPDLPAIWRKGPPFPEAECIHCNLCTQDFLVKGPKSVGVRCVQKEKLEKKRKSKTESSE